MTRFLLILALIPVIATSLPAQAVEVSPGTRIRFTGATVGSTVSVIVLERHGDSLRVAADRGTPFDVLLSQVTRLQISRGKSAWEGAKVGAAWGAGIYLVTGALLLSYDCEDCNSDSDPTDIIPLVLGGAITGGLLGAAIGRERWEDVRLVVKPAGSAAMHDTRLLVGLRVGS